jgi:hypothetical protein
LREAQQVEKKIVRSVDATEKRENLLTPKI